MAKAPQYKIMHLIHKRCTLTPPATLSYMVEEKGKTYVEMGMRILKPWRREDKLPWAKGYEAVLFGTRFLKSQEYRPQFSQYGVYMFGCDLEKLWNTWAGNFNPDSSFVKKNIEILSTFQNKLESGELDEILHREEEY